MRNLVIISCLGLFMISAVHAQQMMHPSADAADQTILCQNNRNTYISFNDNAALSFETALLKKRKKREAKALKLEVFWEGSSLSMISKALQATVSVAAECFRYFNDNLSLGADAGLDYFGAPFGIGYKPFSQGKFIYYQGDDTEGNIIWGIKYSDLMLVFVLALIF